MPFNHKKRSQEAEAKPRDPHGHFTPESEQPSSLSEASRKGGSKLSFLKSIFPTGTNIGKTENEDTLIDVHVNNPLKKIVELLQDIKRQKVFSFSVKGSLGIAGIALVLTGIGLFGGTQAFCSKGIQSHIGTIKTLQIQEEVTVSSIPVISQIPLISQISQIVFPQQTILRNRIILVKSDNSTIRIIPSRNFSLSQFTNSFVITTGNYNSCSQTLNLKDSSSIELFK
ncbi:MAG: hypothetical protein Q7K55_09550 [Candidatus Levybacteria bacterium]|nr:hypothetical protein [Candidatus Levybacteria bacterium]